jgi:predicted glutamine amidotransferase
MCDILAISAGHNYSAKDYLPIFAEKAKKNMSGWGIGFFRNSRALVEKSSEQVFLGDQVHESFQRLARVIDSRIIVCHISCPLSGGHHSGYNNPFSLPFLDHLWLFVNVGREAKIDGYRTTSRPRIEIEVTTARIFEYLRDQLIARLKAFPYATLYGALQEGIRNLVSDYPGYYTFFLTNESVLFAFSNFRQLLVLKKSETYGDILLVTSVGEGLSAEDWVPIQPQQDSPGKLMVVAGPDVLYLEDI